MKTLFKISVIFGMLATFVACTEGFDELGKNPNAAESVNASYYLTKVITRTAYNYNNSAFSGKIPNAARYITKLTNSESDGFNWSAESWDDYYYTLSINKSFYDEAIAEGQEQYAALSEIMAVFNFDCVTSLWGDCPCSEALMSKEEGIVYPSYDKQEVIYPDLLKRLEAANETLASTSKSIDATADIMYKGSALKWRKLANSLRLRMLLKASKSMSSAISDIQAIVSDQTRYPIFTSNADAAEIPYVEQYKWPMGPTLGGAITDQFKEFIKRRPSKEIIDYMLPRNDPRLEALFDKVEDPASCTVDFNDYVGVPIALKSPYGYNGGQSGTSKTVSTFSKEKFYQDTGDYLKASMMIYPEVCFILSEVAAVNGVSVPGETAESLYNKGIKASMEYWGVDDSSAINEYLSNDLVKYDGTQKRILEQKWLALIIKGPESWFDYRRTGDAIGLNAQLVPDNLKQNYIPYRFIYPDNERSYNREKYEAAIAVFGTDDINTKMWLIK